MDSVLDVLVARNRRIDRHRPEIDSAVHASCLAESLLPKVHRGIEAAHAVVADRYDRRFFRPRVHDFLRKDFIDQRTTLDASNFVFVLRTYVDQAHGALLHQSGNLGR